jgi:hypothetical protein
MGKLANGRYLVCPDDNSYESDYGRTCKSDV